MATTGYTTPGTLANDSSVGVVAWSDVANAGADDGSYARATLSALEQQTQYIKATNFGFSLPGGATVNGVSVQVERYKDFGSGSITDYIVRLVKGGTISGDDKAAATVWPTSPTVATYGGPADLWGLTLAQGDINAATFGVVVAARRANGVAGAAVDVVRVQVTYNSGGTDAGTAVGITTGAASIGTPDGGVSGTAGGSFIINDAGDALLINDDGDALLWSEEDNVATAVGFATGAPVLGTPTGGIIAATTITGSEGFPPVFWIDVLEGTTKLGDGPITTATYWRHAPQLSRAGRFEFAMPAADPRAALLASKRIVTCYALQDGAMTAQGSGIIDRIEVDAGPPAMLRVSGDDLTRELTYRVMEELRIAGTTETSPVNVDFYPNVDGGAKQDLTNTYDSDLNTGHNITIKSKGTDDGGTANNGDALFLEYTAFPGAVWFELGTYRNGYLRTTDFEYWRGSGWAPLNAEDGTRRDGAAFNQSGLVSWATPDDVVTGGLSGVTNYLIRIRGALGTSSYSYGMVSFMEIYAIEEGESTADITEIMTLAPAGWTLDTTNWYASTVNGALLQFQDETVLTALIKLAEQTGEAFRIDGREVEWLRTDTPDSGIRIVGPVGDPALIAAESDQAAIGQGGLQKIEDTYEEVTRLYPYGAGNGPARLTLAEATDSAPSGYTLSTTGNYLERTGASPRIDRAATFADIRAVSNSGDAVAAAANRLLAAAHAWLEARRGYVAYELRQVYGLPATLKVGETVRLVYREQVGAYAAVNIDANLVVLGIERQVDARGVLVGALTVASRNRQPVTDEDALVDVITRLEDMQAYPQTQDSNYVV